MYILSLLTLVLTLAMSGAFRPHPRNFIQYHSRARMMSTNDDTVVSRCTKKIMDMLETDKCIVRSSSDDPNGAHITIECISEKFAGLRSMQRQQLLYKAIWNEMQDGGPVHAVDSIIAKTPDEVGL